MNYDFSIIVRDFFIFIPAAIETIKITSASIVFGVLIEKKLAISDRQGVNI